MNSEYRYSDGSMIKHVAIGPKSASGFVYPDKIPTDKPCVIALGGELTYADIFARRYTDHIYKLLNKHDLKDIDIYGVVYTFGDWRPDLYRADMFRRAGRKLRLSDTSYAEQRMEEKLHKMRDFEPTPAYIEDLFEMIIEPRILDKNGNRFTDMNMVNKNMRNLIFYAHCHGGLALNLLAEHTRTTMKKSGYSADEIKTALKNVLVVQHNPVTPLEKAGFTTVSFASATDTTMKKHENIISKYILSYPEDIPPSFLGEKAGNLFIASELFLNRQRGEKEHGFWGFVEHPARADAKSQNGNVIFAAEGNAIVNGVKSALEGRPIPPVAELVAGDGVDFEQMKQRGDQFYNEMLAKTRQMKRNLRPDCQK